MAVRTSDEQNRNPFFRAGPRAGMQIRIVHGTGTGPTRMSSYDAALAAANVHNYNLVSVSSVIPADADVEAVGTAPDLGPAGHRLTVVRAYATSGEEPVSAALAWNRSEEGPGLVYEAGGPGPAERVRERAERGLSAGEELREWTFEPGESDSVIRTATPGDEGEGFATAVALAVYGRARPIR
jgi:arginine decarboxylase